MQKTVADGNWSLTRLSLVKGDLEQDLCSDFPAQFVFDAGRPATGAWAKGLPGSLKCALALGPQGKCLQRSKV